MRVDYLCGLSVYHDYVCFEHYGFARNRAERWWFAHGGDAPVPRKVDEALERCLELDRATEITVFRNGDFWNVMDRKIQRANGNTFEIDRNYQTWAVELTRPRSRSA